MRLSATDRLEILGLKKLSVSCILYLFIKKKKNSDISVLYIYSFLKVSGYIRYKAHMRHTSEAQYLLLTSAWICRRSFRRLSDS